MPAHGPTPNKVLELLTREGGSWWLALATNRPLATETTADLADIPPLEVPQDDTAWADPADGQVSHLTGVTMPEADSDTTAAAWCLFNDEACTELALSRWFAEDREVAAGVGLTLSAEVLTIEHTPSTYPYL
jgi:hypothetical protein